MVANVLSLTAWLRYQRVKIFKTEFESTVLQSASWPDPGMQIMQIYISMSMCSPYVLKVSLFFYYTSIEYRCFSPWACKTEPFPLLAIHAIAGLGKYCHTCIYTGILLLRSYYTLRNLFLGRAPRRPRYAMQRLYALSFDH